MVRGHVTRHGGLSRKHFFRPTPWWAAELLHGQHKNVDIPPARARTAHKGLLRKRPEEDLCLSCPPDDPFGRGTGLK